MLELKELIYLKRIVKQSIEECKLKEKEKLKNLEQEVQKWRLLPLTLILPYADLFWTGVLTIMINLIMASAFASILLYAMDLLPNRIGLIGGLFYGLNFGLGGVAAGFLGVLAENYGVETVFLICSFLPLAGLLAWFLPRIDEG